MHDLNKLSDKMVEDNKESVSFTEVNDFPRDAVLEVVAVNGRRFARVYWDFLESHYPDRNILYVRSKISDADNKYSVVVISICKDDDRSVLMLKLLKSGYPVTFGRTTSTFVGGM